ncbi:MAG: hypothetical protein ACRECR_04265, partial [Thermoplasmata archaeon]
MTVEGTDRRCHRRSGGPLINSGRLAGSEVSASFSLLDTEGDLERALARIEGRSAYADVLAEESGGYLLRVEKSLTTPTSSPKLRGATFRAWTGERWAETVARSLGPRELDRAADALSRELERGPSATGTPPGPAPTGNREFRTETRRPMEEVPIDEQIELARHWFRIAT